MHCYSSQCGKVLYFSHFVFLFFVRQKFQINDFIVFLQM